MNYGLGGKGQGTAEKKQYEKWEDIGTGKSVTNAHTKANGKEKF